MPALDYSRLADLYDTYVKVDFDIPFFLQEASQTPGEVLELMAGTGRVSLPLIIEGIRLTCIDASDEMLTVLREKLRVRGLSAAVYQMGICNLELNKRFQIKLKL